MKKIQTEIRNHKSLKLLAAYLLIFLFLIDINAQTSTISFRQLNHIGRPYRNFRKRL